VVIAMVDVWLREGLKSLCGPNYLVGANYLEKGQSLIKRNDIGSMNASAELIVPALMSATETII
jgi:hypothetical protein